MDDYTKYVYNEIEKLESSIFDLSQKIKAETSTDKVFILIESLDSQKWRLDQFLNDI
jgi:hypothetical protein